MQEIVYQALDKYFHALELTGYIPDSQTKKLLVLTFYGDFIYNDYRGLLSKEDYSMIENALDCIYGSTCLIPYPDYLKMGKLHLGSTTELAARIRTLENTKVMKGDSNSDTQAVADIDTNL